MSAARKQECRALLCLAAGFAVLYGYFYQGGGWNQNSHFDVVRAIVERRSVEITAFATNTGDIGRSHGRVYSNKGPGLALLATPAYLALVALERALGLRVDSNQAANLNAHVLGFVTSGLPGIALVLLLFQHFRRASATLAESLFLATSFGAGTLVLPYAGLMMSHVFTACALFGAWHVLSAARGSRRSFACAGLLTGLCVVTDLLAAPIALLFAGYAWRRHGGHVALAYIAGGAVIAALLALYDHAVFGAVFVTNQTLESSEFQTPGLLFGMLGAPQLQRLYWLSVHPFRGIFYGCPVLLLPLLGLPTRMRMRELDATRVLPLLVIASYVAFNLSFNGWTGGWGMGARYLIPMFPFLFSFALAGLRAAPAFGALLSAVSCLFMLAVSAVGVMIPARNGGRASDVDPIAESLGHLMRGQVSISTQGVLDHDPAPDAPHAAWASYNLGELFGLHGVVSLAPALMVLLGLIALWVDAARSEGARAINEQ